jgi:hypothetical protein
MANINNRIGANKGVSPLGLATPKRGFRGPVCLYLHDDLPRFGCGWRRLFVRVGNKHVHIRAGDGNGRRISRQLFDRLIAETADCYQHNAR